MDIQLTPKGKKVISPPVPKYPFSEVKYIMFHLGIEKATIDEAATWLKVNCFTRMKDRSTMSLFGHTSEFSERNKIELSSIFKKAVGNGVSDDWNVDLHRFISNNWSPPKHFTAVNAIVKRATDTAAKLLLCPNWTLRKASILYSTPDGDDQGMHQDDARDKSLTRTEGAMGTILISVMEGTKINMWFGRRKQHRRVIEIPPGHCIVFDGNQNHSGCGYEQENIRLHLYIGRWGLQMDNEIRTVFECNICGKVKDNVAQVHVCRSRCKKRQRELQIKVQKETDTTSKK